MMQDIKIIDTCSNDHPLDMLDNYQLFGEAQMLAKVKEKRMTSSKMDRFYYSNDECT